AQASLALRPARLLNRPRRPLSRGFDAASYPAAPLVSYQTDRLLSGWVLPPLVIRALGAHGKGRPRCCNSRTKMTRRAHHGSRGGHGGAGATTKLTRRGRPLPTLRDPENHSNLTVRA